MTGAERAAEHAGVRIIHAHGHASHFGLLDLELASGQFGTVWVKLAGND